VTILFSNFILSQICDNLFFEFFFVTDLWRFYLTGIYKKQLPLKQWQLFLILFLRYPLIAVRYNFQLN